MTGPDFQPETRIRKKRRFIDEPGHAHFATFSCWHRLPLLNRDRSRQWMLESIHANPVRRGLVGRAADWMWSSAGVFAGISTGPLAIDPVFVD